MKKSKKYFIFMLSFCLITVSFFTKIIYADGLNNPYSDRFNSSINSKLEFLVEAFEQEQYTRTTTEFINLLDSFSIQLTALQNVYPNNSKLNDFVLYFKYEIERMLLEVSIVSAIDVSVNSNNPVVDDSVNSNSSDGDNNTCYWSDISTTGRISSPCYSASPIKTVGSECTCGTYTSGWNGWTGECKTEGDNTYSMGRVQYCSSGSLDSNNIMGNNSGTNNSGTNNSEETLWQYIIKWDAYTGECTGESYGEGGGKSAYKFTSEDLCQEYLNNALSNQSCKTRTTSTMTYYYRYSHGYCYSYIVDAGWCDNNSDVCKQDTSNGNSGDSGNTGNTGDTGDTGDTGSNSSSSSSSSSSVEKRLCRIMANEAYILETFGIIKESDCKNKCTDFTNPENKDSQYFGTCFWGSREAGAIRDILEPKPWCYIQKDGKEPTDPINYMETEEKCLDYCEGIAEDDYFNGASCYYDGEVIEDNVRTQVPDDYNYDCDAREFAGISLRGGDNGDLINQGQGYYFECDANQWKILCSDNKLYSISGKSTKSQVCGNDDGDEYMQPCPAGSYIKEGMVTSININEGSTATISGVEVKCEGGEIIIINDVESDYSSSTCNGDIIDSCRMGGFSGENREDIGYVDLTDSSTQYKWKCGDVTCTKDKETSVSTTSYDCEAQSFDGYSLIGTNNNNSITLSGQKFKCSSDKWYVKCSNGDYERISGGSSIDSVCPADSGTSEEDITELYWDLLGRAPKSSGLTYRLNSGFTKSQIESSIKESDEYKIIQLYWKLLGRAPNSSGLEYRLNSGFTISQIESSIKESDEYKNSQ